MKTIGFENFRRFANFPPIDLGDITILVGGNNAGKSTVVKGILAISDFINGNNFLEVESFLSREDMFESNGVEVNKKFLDNIRFYFNTSYLAHIGTFKRALYNKADYNEKKNSYITFKTDLVLYKLSIVVEGNKDDDEAVCGKVVLIKVNIPYYNIDIEFDIPSDNAIITFNPYTEDDLSGISLTLRDVITEYFKRVTKKISITTTITSNWRPYRSNIIHSLIDSIEKSIESTIKKYREKIEYKNNDYSHRLLGNPITEISKENVDFLLHLFDDSLFKESQFGFKLPGLRMFYSSGVNIEYIYAHAVTQTVIYSAKDTNDYLSRTVHEFASLQSHTDKRKFIIKWMKEFGIGQNFTIKSVGGEAHIVYIINQDGERVNLADKGMGSIQLMVLLFRLAINLPKYGISMVKNKILNKKIIIIEEPEQNLHPMLQSKLADLFYELNTRYFFNFIVETHSEYLVRRSQVLVGEMDCKTQEEIDKKNPFKVFYFPQNGVPFDMGMATTGKFLNSFDEGFFDVAAKLNMEVIRRERKK